MVVATVISYMSMGYMRNHLYFYYQPRRNGMCDLTTLSLTTA